MTLQTFALPDVGEGLTEAEILDWRVAPGDEVGINQIIVEIETAKAAVELPSPFAGRVASLLVKTGETVDVGVPIITIETDAGADAVAGVATAGVSTGAAAGVAAASADPDAGTKIGEMTTDGKIATLVGYLSPTSTAGRRARKPIAGVMVPAKDAGSSGAVTVTPTVTPPVTPVTVTPVPTAVHGAVPLASPPVRMLAKSLGIDLGSVRPTGAGGVITRVDVEQAASGHAGSRQAPVAPGSASSGGVGTSGGRAADAARQRRVPIKGLRKATAAAMVASAFTAPHVTVFQTVDVTEMMALRSRLRSRPEYAEVKLTPLAFAARAVCLALTRSPDLNAFWDDATHEIVHQDYVHLGIAAATPRGLVVPNIRDADALDLRGLAEALTELTETARAGRTTPAAMSGGTFTITNIGVFGVDAGTPIINPGESAILAVGAIRDAPWVVDGQLAVRKVCQLSLSFDHRLIDGAQGSLFLAEVGAVLAEPGLALAW